MLAWAEQISTGHNLSSFCKKRNIAAPMLTGSNLYVSPFISLISLIQQWSKGERNHKLTSDVISVYLNEFTDIFKFSFSLQKISISFLLNINVFVVFTTVEVVLATITFVLY